jgi:IS4 transposase
MRLSYRDSLRHAIRGLFPAAFFSQFPVRKRLTWTPQRIFWVAVLMAYSAEQTLADRFDAVADLLRALFPRWRLGRGYDGFLRANAAWAAVVQPAAAARLRRQLRAAAGAHWTWRGWCAFAVDGTRVECPRTAANQAGLGCADKDRSGPQLYLTALYHLGTALPWDYRVGPGTASELRHLEGMVGGLPGRSLLVADCGFAGYRLCRELDRAGHAFLIRVGSNRRLIRHLGYAPRERADTVYLWPHEARGEPPLGLRLVVLRRGRQEVHLLTNAPAEALPRPAAAELYELRWGVEVFFRTCKQTLQRRKMLSRTPAGCAAELGWAVLGVWVLGLLSVAAIVARGGDPLGWSAALARKRVRQAMRGAGGRVPRTVSAGLAEAVQDGYRRRGSKQSRDCPRKKQRKPPGAPKMREATAAEKKRVKRLKQREAA